MSGACSALGMGFCELLRRELVSILLANSSTYAEYKLNTYIHHIYIHTLE